MRSFPHPWRGVAGLPREAWILCAATLVNRAGTMVLPFLALYLVQDLGFAAGRAGLVLTIYGATALGVAPLAGRLCDRVGSLPILRASLFSSAFVLLLFPWARGLAAIVAGTVLLAITNEAFRPASLSILAGLVPRDRQKAVFALNRLAINLGMSVGPAVGGFLVLASFRAIFFVDAATSILAGIVLLTVRPRIASAPAPPGASGGRPDLAGPAHANRRFLFFLAATIPVSIVFFQHGAALPLHLVSGVGLPESVYGLLFTVNTLGIVLLEVQVNSSTAHWPHGRSLSVGSALCAAGFFGYAFVSGTRSAVATTLVWTFGEMILFPGASAYVAEVAPPERRGEYMGLYMTAFGVAFAVGPWLGTEILGRFGPGALWTAMGVLGGVSAIAFAFLPRPTALRG